MRNSRDEEVVEAVPYDPRLVGQDLPRIVLGKGSGVDNVREHLERHGLTADEDQVQALLARVKEASLGKQDLLEPDEFLALAADVLG